MKYKYLSVTVTYKIKQNHAVHKYYPSILYYYYRNVFTNSIS